jgi:hypothetical protein
MSSTAIVAEIKSTRGYVPTSANPVERQLGCDSAPFDSFLLAFPWRGLETTCQANSLAPVGSARCARLSPHCHCRQLRWDSEGFRKPFMSVCRSEGGDASKYIEDAVMTDAGGSGPPPAGSTSEQLRATLRKNTKPDLMEKCKAAGISGYSKKRKDELIDLLVRKKPRPTPSDEQVQL